MQASMHQLQGRRDHNSKDLPVFVFFHPYPLVIATGILGNEGMFCYKQGICICIDILSLRISLKGLMPNILYIQGEPHWVPEDDNAR